MKTTISITLDTEDTVARSILYQIISAIDAAPEDSVLHDPESGSFYDVSNPFHVAMRAAELKRQEQQQQPDEPLDFSALSFLEEPTSDRREVREFDPIEVRARHLPVLQKLKKGKLTAKQLAAKLPGHWTQQEVSNSLNYLKRYELVERQVGSRYWLATAKAKAHPLVAA